VGTARRGIRFCVFILWQGRAARASVRAADGSASRPYRECGRLGPSFANPASLGATQDKGYAEASEATLPDLRFVQTGGATNQNAFPPSDGRKAEVRVNQKSILAIGITPLLFDS
jgi:hypothetical protein